MIICRISGDDWRDWRTIRIRSLTEAPDAFVPQLTGVDDREVTWRSRIDGAIGCWIAYDDEPVGMIAADAMDDGRVQLASMFVGAEARGAGVGAALIREVIQVAGERVLFLRVKAGNEAALSAYARAGFALVNDRADADGCLTMVFGRATG